MKWLRLYTGALMLWGLLMIPGVAFSEDVLAKEYSVKAAFLYNFARLVEWPEAVFNDNKPIRICVIGEDRFGHALDTIANKKVKNKRLAIYRGVTLDELAACHILFIDSSERTRLQTIFQRLKGHPVLTVSDMSGFAQQGGHIRFFVNRYNTLGLEVNHNAIVQAKLKISSRILMLAKIVSSDEALSGQ